MGARKLLQASYFCTSAMHNQHDLRSLEPIRGHLFTTFGGINIGKQLYLWVFCEYLQNLDMCGFVIARMPLQQPKVIALAET